MDNNGRFSYSCHSGNFKGVKSFVAGTSDRDQIYYFFLLYCNITAIQADTPEDSIMYSVALGRWFKGQWFKGLQVILLPVVIREAWGGA